MLKSKFLRKSRQTGKYVEEKQLPTESESDKNDQTNLNIDINKQKKDENYFKMPTGNSGFKFDFNVDKNAE